ncbi:PREDICTED: uncharacterized protein LOC109243966 [Nicotiana attenuata]|uniref:uncharacterized protein LOC109243966 n=1 Tax=Nicotiana attenuata TaxID=49451 RepID=UPI00090504CB|nr:PREDICTED: uncharacterized protein LOC109243966 [Nicotiana attenuata]
MSLEFEALHANHTWDLVPLPTGKRPIGCRWVYKIKHKADGSVERLRPATAVKKHWGVFQLDVNNAFLHGDLHEEVYMDLPPRLLVDTPGLGNNSEEINSLKAFLNAQFKIKDLGRLYYFLGLEVLYREDGVIISQRKFALDLLKEYEFLHVSAFSSPLDPTVKLQAKEGVPLADPCLYRTLIGKLNFLTNTRLDIAYNVHHLSQFMQDPREPHLKAAYHLLRYLKVDPTLGIFMSASQDCTVRGYCDSDWAACPDSRKSVSGYLVLLGDSSISWKSKKQATISLSSVDVEYRALKNVVGELV